MNRRAFLTCVSGAVVVATAMKEFEGGEVVRAPKVTLEDRKFENTTINIDCDRMTMYNCVFTNCQLNFIANESLLVANCVFDKCSFGGKGFMFGSVLLEES